MKLVVEIARTDKESSMNKKAVAQELIRVAKLLQAIEFDTQDAYDKYMKDHPDADKSNHSVKTQEKKEPASKPLKETIKENIKEKGETSKEWEVDEALIRVRPTKKDIKEWEQVLKKHPDWKDNSVSDPNATTLQSIALWNSANRKLDKILRGK